MNLVRLIERKMRYYKFGSRREFGSTKAERAKACVATLVGNSILAWRQASGQHISLAFVEQAVF